MRAAQHAGLELEFHFVPFAETYRQLEDICLLGRELGVTSVSVLRFVPQGRGMLFRKHALSRLQSVDPTDRDPFAPQARLLDPCGLPVQLSIAG